MRDLQEKMAYLVGRIRYQMYYAESVTGLPFNTAGGKTCLLCDGRPGSCAAPSQVKTDPPVHVKINNTSKTFLPDELFLGFLWHRHVYIQIARCPACYSSGILAQLQSSKQNRELDHVLYLKSEAP